MCFQGKSLLNFTQGSPDSVSLRLTHLGVGSAEEHLALRAKIRVSDRVMGELAITVEAVGLVAALLNGGQGYGSMLLAGCVLGTGAVAAIRKSLEWRSRKYIHTCSRPIVFWF